MLQKIQVAIFLITFCGIANSETLRAYLMTSPASNNFSEVHIINTSESPQQFTGTLFSGDGSQVGAGSVTLHDSFIQPQGRLILSSADIADLFDTVPWQGPAMIEVFSDSDFKIMVKLRSPSGFVSNTNCVAKNTVHNIEGADQRDATFIRFINVGTQKVSDITGSLYGTDGSLIGSADSTIISALGPKEQVWVNNSQLENIFNSTWNGPATLDVTGHDDLRLLNLNYVNSETFFNFSCFEGTLEETEVANESSTSASWDSTTTEGSWYGVGYPLIQLSAPSCTESLIVSATVTSDGYFSGTAQRSESLYSIDFDALVMPQAPLLIMGLAVDYQAGYGASFSGVFPNDSTLLIFGRDTDGCYTQFPMNKQ